MKNTHKRKKGFVKTWAGKLHMWFGLVIGFLIFIISITGAMYVFKDEVQNALRKHVIYHGETNTNTKTILPLRALEEKVNLQTKEKYPLHWAEIPVDKNRSYKFFYYEHNPKGWNYFNELTIYKTAYVNPYTGHVLAVYDEKNGFFNIVKFIHWSFLLKSSWGKYIAGIPVLIFVVMLITGIILWWPKNKKARGQRFWFQWKNIKNWRRKNYDLHSILGFYASFIALIISITGLFYAFFFVKAFIYMTFSGGSTAYPDFSHITTKAPVQMRTAGTLDKIGQKVEELYPAAYSYNLDFGHEHTDNHKHPNFTVFVKQLSYSYHINHNLIFDENSGELLHTRNYKDKNLGEKAIAANYDVHVGAIWGIWGKVLAFVASLICASLPVTGFLVWWGRRKKAHTPKLCEIQTVLN